MVKKEQRRRDFEEDIRHELHLLSSLMVAPLLCISLSALGPPIFAWWPVYRVTLSGFYAGALCGTQSFPESPAQASLQPLQTAPPVGEPGPHRQPWGKASRLFYKPDMAAPSGAGPDPTRAFPGPRSEIGFGGSP